ncbi:hypothetical protein [Lentzea cavernae]|uniref:Uncharacterized protein n=1 Tax=Lentzea cavernae TaxID=2020703 RepID=A0ABQ3MU16_9PSEU|nr:hypothetical protein [Lentzea cavernae]GHH57704.1 hypothetical protein GCM10017774_77700 [Lentzea cavernae]
MRYVEIPGEFEAVQWTGDNVAEVAELVGTYRGPNWEWTPQPDGTLYGTAGMDNLLLPEGEWFVVGPMWGGEEPINVPFKQLPAPTFSARHTQAPVTE